VRRSLTAFAAIVVHFVLAPAAMAHAECAWVLWRGAAFPLAGYGSRQECESARNDDHALAQRLSREYAHPQTLECRPDRESTESRTRCSWTLWKAAVPSLERSPLGSFDTRELCEQRRAPDTMKRDERELTSCLPDTVDPRAGRAR
jgi:hypothetical protein